MLDNPETLPSGEARLERLAKQVATHDAASYVYKNDAGYLTVDVQTAARVVSVANALKPANRAKFLAMDLAVMIGIAWEIA